MPAEKNRKLTIVADTRESASGIPAALEKKGFEVKILQLKIADYILSPNLAVERKTTADFIQSIIDRRLFSQVTALRQNFSSPVLLLEKCEKPLRSVHQSAIRGAMVYTSVTNRIPILYTKDMNDTVEMLSYLASLEKSSPVKSHFSFFPKRKASSRKLTQHYILEAIPGVGPALAVLLLKTFGSLHAVLNASQEELATIEGIGNKRAGKIHELFQRKYE